MNTNILTFLKISKYRLIIQPQEEIFLPEYKGSAFRGAFGASFRKICCVQRQNVCNNCLLKDNCAYSFIFESSPASNSEKLRNLEEIPRPFIIESPLTDKKLYTPSEMLEFDLILIGKAIEYLPYVIFSFIELGKTGLGKCRGRFKLEKVVNDKNEIVYDGKSNVIYNNNSVVRIEIPQTNITNILKISFLSPTRIKYNGHYQNKPEFHVIIRALLRRISSLIYFYCGSELNIDFKKLISNAKDLKMISNNLRWVDWERYSSRQKTRMKLGGIVGDVIYTGDFRPFIPFLLLGEYIHIGKNCTFGLVKYKLITTV